MLSRVRSRPTTDNRWDPDDVPWIVAGLLGVLVTLTLFAYLLDYSALDVWTGIVTFLVLTTVSVPMFRWVARADGDPWLSRTLFVAWLVKCAASMARFFMIFVLYGGSADAGRYHEAGAIFARRLRDGVPTHPIDIIAGFPVETQRIGDVVGGLYTVTGPSAYAGFIAFSFLCFWGQVLVVRAFRVAVPEGDQRRFALLALFLPSLLFWPSSLGKEALMIFCLGIIVYGGALLLAPRPRIRGAVYFVAGSALVLLFRPHIAAMSIGALIVAMVVGVLAGYRGTGTGTGRGRVVRIAALIVVLVVASAAMSRVGEFFGDDGESATAGSALETTAKNSATGGSEFVPIAVTGPSELPFGIVSVYFRPFPWEAANVNSLIAALESLLLLGLFALSWRRLLSLPGLALKRPFLVFCGVYVVVFAVGFSYFANFGILARQRVQALPILLVFLALPAKELGPIFGARRRAEQRAAAADEVDSDGGAGNVGEMVGVEPLRGQGVR